jgi:hypothetical protein
MPFTLAHPAAVLPFHSKWRTGFLALVIGSLGPDIHISLLLFPAVAQCRSDVGMDASYRSRPSQSIHSNCSEFCNTAAQSLEWFSSLYGVADTFTRRVIRLLPQAGGLGHGCLY